MRIPNEDEEVLFEEDMDIVGKLFGIRFVDGGLPNGLIEVYIEDDENYFYKHRFNAFWLPDLLEVIQKTIEQNPFVEKKE